MPVELNIVESVTELDTTVVTIVLESASEPGPAGPGVPTGGTDGQVLTKTSGTDYATAWEDPTGGGGGGAPDDVDYLVGTASGDLSAEIVVGTSPQGELGGTWASPTVDATHSGSSHASVQAAAEATAAGELSTHAADTTGIHGITDTAALALTTDVVTKALFDANTVLKADSDNTPAALTMGASTILARLAAGNIVAATPAELRTLLALVIGTNVQAWDADLDTYAGITPSANVQSLLAAANYAAMRALLDLEAGTDFPSLAVFNDHDTRHEAGGGDEMSIAGLSGIPTELQTHLDDTTAHTAANIPFTPDGTIAATNVQAAIVEVRDEAGGSSAVSFIPSFFCGG